MTIELSDPIILFLLITGTLITLSISFIIGILYERKHSNIQYESEDEFKNRHQ